MPIRLHSTSLIERTAEQMAKVRQAANGQQMSFTKFGFENIFDSKKSCQKRDFHSQRELGFQAVRVNQMRNKVRKEHQKSCIDDGPPESGVLVHQESAHTRRDPGKCVTQCPSGKQHQDIGLVIHSLRAHHQTSPGIERDQTTSNCLKRHRIQFDEYHQTASNGIELESGIKQYWAPSTATNRTAAKWSPHGCLVAIQTLSSKATKIQN